MNRSTGARVHALEHTDEIVDSLVGAMFDRGGNKAAIRNWLDAVFGRPADRETRKKRDQLQELLRALARRPEAEQTLARDLARTMLKTTLERAD
jgi:hypothetical protein